MIVVPVQKEGVKDVCACMDQRTGLLPRFSFRVVSFVVFLSVFGCYL